MTSSWLVGSLLYNLWCYRMNPPVYRRHRMTFPTPFLPFFINERFFHLGFIFQEVVFLCSGKLFLIQMDIRIDVESFHWTEIFLWDIPGVFWSWVREIAAPSPKTLKLKMQLLCRSSPDLAQSQILGLDITTQCRQNAAAPYMAPWRHFRRQFEKKVDRRMGNGVAMWPQRYSAVGGAAAPFPAVPPSKWRPFNNSVTFKPICFKFG